MNDDLARWQQANNAYLSAALKWLRARLARMANSEVPIATRTAMLAEAQAALQGAAKAIDPPPAAIILSRRFGLSGFELEILLLCAALELDTSIAGLCARAQDDPNRPYPTFALALALFDDPAWDALSPERPLRRWQMIEINQPGAQPLSTSPLRADERIVSYLKGLNYLDDRLAVFLAPFEVADDEGELPPSQAATVDAIMRQLDRAAADRRAPIIQLVGADRLSKQLVARRAAARVGLQLYRLPAGLLPAQTSEIETLARLWERETVLMPVALYLDAHETGSPTSDDRHAPMVNRFMTRSSGLFFLDSRETRTDLGRPTFSLDVAKPTPLEQQAAWQDALGSAAGESPARLAGQFNLNLVTIREIAQTVLSDEPDDEQELHHQLWDACLVRTRPQLDQLAQRLEPMATWDDIVLPSQQLESLRRIASQVSQRIHVYDAWGFRQKMTRGFGINALFAGESGTGKTMAAEVIANDLGLNLYRIDLSAVVSKYIGETEKNLRRLFDAAEDGGAILFFDEADALFGKRSEVRDSHDRYANIEINYLLQRMESYRGLAILATNMKSALDQAFVRRLRFIVDFPFPGREERRAMWEKAFPPQTPVEGLDPDRLARLNLTGGSIHNIALNAAFMAAHTGGPVTMPVVLSAARAEFHKLERPINEADFRWEAPKSKP